MDLEELNSEDMHNFDLKDYISDYPDFPKK